MTDALRVWWFKRKARRAYLAWQSTMDGMTCGVALGTFISAAARKHALAFDAAMERLAQIDPQTPTIRLEPGHD
jgi:hypothetical protein